ncbi:hypothetical protein LCGC14_2610830 [marine sediment metagenome]|uniref:Uncharacterized protein n=1 Tax=marine sediment metagenome TaxID=412755 RepID=A0A0F9CYP8_9ZZZZ
MTDKDYRVHAEWESKYVAFNVSMIKSRNLNRRAKQLVWLQLMGLYETWTMIQ